VQGHLGACGRLEQAATASKAVAVLRPLRGHPGCEALSDINPGPWQGWVYGGQPNPWEDARWVEARYKSLCAMSHTERENALAKAQTTKEPFSISGSGMAKVGAGPTRRSVGHAERGRPRAEIPEVLAELAAQGLGSRRIAAELRRQGYGLSERTIARELARLRQNA